MQSIFNFLSFINLSEIFRHHPMNNLGIKIGCRVIDWSKGQSGPGDSSRLFTKISGYRRSSFSYSILALACMLVFLPPQPASAQTAAEESTSELIVNINEADAEELAKGLLGIGPSKALAIVRYREQFGRFESLEELGEVAGIGAATVERNRNSMVLQ
ncbi:MAG: ComEA family DNA-binding protein [Pseudomonadota bacterium]